MRLLVIDGNSIVNRAFYGIKLLSTKDGQYTNALVGFLNILQKLQDMAQPDHVAVAFDLSAPTFRHEKYAAYKAGRKGMPEELRQQIPVLKQLLREKQVAVILSLHEIDLAQKLSDRLICVHNGRIERCGTPEQVFTGDYIRTLYDLERGTYNEQFGSLELERVTGELRVFVIGGGGSGTALYRRLQRRGIPFAAGVLPENDVELPTARALAVETVTERAYQPIGEDAYARAQALVRQCGNAV